MLMKVALSLCLLMLLPGAALAQPAKPPLAASEPETVYSDAQREKDDAMARRFVQSLLQPSYSLDGQFKRWKIQVCPHVVGLDAAAAYVVERRIRDVAQKIGAPVDRKDPCRPNIVVFVTPHPQALLDATAKKEFWLVAGTHPRQDRLTVKYPVQSWYFGMYRDYNGRYWMDMDCEFYLDNCPPHVAARGTLLVNGIDAEMIATTILVDSHAVSGMTLGSLADYVALMALAQAPATGNCQPAPSIANLFLTDCGADLHTTELSDVDLAMLAALYETPEEPEKLQWQRLAGNMRRHLEGGQK
jgi:hypothetical protein